MNIVFLGFFVGISFGIVAYISTSNFIISGVVFAMSLLYFLIFGSKILNKYKVKINRFHECYYFVNNFVVSLSIKESLSAAFESVIGYGGDSFKEVLSTINDLPEMDKLKYLQKYFKFHVYKLFIDLLDVFIEEGGDVIKMSQYLINDMRMIEEYIIQTETMTKRKAFEFITLWAFSLIILVSLRFALSQFYSYIIDNIFYLGGIIIFFIFILLSCHILLTKINNIELRGWVDEK